LKLKKKKHKKKKKRTGRSSRTTPPKNATQTKIQLSPPKKNPKNQNKNKPTSKIQKSRLLQNTHTNILIFCVG
jgi:hypothetical protein